ncbi:hypothetical protein [Aureispira anguillae]|nr:hypothetical protein [Aureispira anguillae]
MTSPILDDNKSKKISLNEFFNDDNRQFIQLGLAIIFSMHILVGFHDTNELYKYLEDSRNVDFGVLTTFLFIIQYIGGGMLCFLSLFLGALIVGTFFEDIDIKGKLVIGGLFIISSIGIICLLSFLSWTYVSYLITINTHPQLIILLHWTLPYSLGLIIWSILFWSIAFVLMPKVL